uniref:P2X purinoreceptor 7 intracellular domain-containing protein n=1 Tax=Cyprinodon variegatus TaxID=28743 RepID=A0A3Q2GM27_CYPVA
MLIYVLILQAAMTLPYYFEAIHCTFDSNWLGHMSLFQPSWCICQRCREMLTLVEKKCCNQQPEMCISRLPHMDLYILQKGVLRLARMMWNELRAVADLPDPGEDNRQFRHAAYRQFVAWQYGVLGSGHRVVIPSCCLWRIRDCFPDPHGQYRGFIPRRV